MRLTDSLLKQHNTGPYIGAFLALYTRTGVFVSFISILMLASTFWSTGARDYIQLWLPWFSFWMFLAVLFVILLVSMLVVWKIVEPSIVSHMNKQGWTHNNPSRAEFQRLHERFDLMESVYKEGFAQLNEQIKELLSEQGSQNTDEGPRE